MCVQRLPQREVLLTLLAAILPEADNWVEVVGVGSVFVMVWTGIFGSLSFSCLMDIIVI